MTPRKDAWTKEELLLAVNLYTKLPFGKLHSGTREIIELAAIIGRTPGAVAYKLNNFASFDPELKARGVKGLGNTSKLDRQVWDEFYGNWDELFLKSEELLQQKRGSENLDLAHQEPLDYTDGKVGEDRQQWLKVRTNQHLFRQMLLASYNNTCCFTGIRSVELLVASHIIPWSISKADRLNPSNGLCLNALHDKAFDRYLITVDADSLKIKVSSRILKSENGEFGRQMFAAIDGKEIHYPQKFFPSKDALRFHNDHFLD